MYYVMYCCVWCINTTNWTCGAARKSPTSGVEEEENNEWRAMNGRDGHWELKQSPRKRDKGGILAPLSARRGVRAGILTEIHTESVPCCYVLVLIVCGVCTYYAPCTFGQQIPCLAPQSNTTQLGREEDDQFASENEKHVARCSSLPRCFLLFLLLLVVRTLYVCM